MKPLTLFLAALVLTSCAKVHVSETYVASSTFEPKAIYVRPFTVLPGAMIGDQGRDTTTAMRQAMFPIEFANALQEELAKIAPALVLAASEEAPLGWVVEGEFDLIDGGGVPSRAFLGIFGAGQSRIRAHVKVSDAMSGHALYAFDVSGGSGLTGPFGNTGASGLGTARHFDMRNMAERIRKELSLDPERHGMRTNR